MPTAPTPEILLLQLIIYSNNDLGKRYIGRYIELFFKKIFHFRTVVEKYCFMIKSRFIITHLAKKQPIKNFEKEIKGLKLGSKLEKENYQDECNIIETIINYY